MALSIGSVDIGIGAAGAPSWGWRDGPLTRGSDAATACPIWGQMEDGWTEVDVDGIRTAIDDLPVAAFDDLQLERARHATPHPNGALGVKSGGPRVLPSTAASYLHILY